MDDKYWKEKVEKVVKMSKIFGFPEQNTEFWNTQPAGVLSFVCKLIDTIERNEY